MDPDEPSVTVLELQDGTYVEVARSVCSDPVTVTSPYPMVLVAQELLDG